MIAPLDFESDVHVPPGSPTRGLSMTMLHEKIEGHQWESKKWGSFSKNRDQLDKYYIYPQKNMDIFLKF